jgi:hypothetical protein
MVIDLFLLRCDGGEVGGDTGLDQGLVDLSQGLLVADPGFRELGEVESVGAVELDIDQAGRDDAAAQVDGDVRDDVLRVEDLLAAHDLARAGAHPQVLLNQRIPLHQAAVGELGDTVPRAEGGGRHGSGAGFCAAAAAVVIVPHGLGIFGIYTCESRGSRRNTPNTRDLAGTL